MSKSMAALGNSGQPKLFIAAKFWGEADKEIALMAGYGILFENGDDLSVIPNMLQ